ncbi:diguanylate cyclase [Catenovulum sp. 2E275]|uniref:GGDEF domain-containing protein n=1 Tax=Catenovulum sp. 2E275 TaxID=2980497 RepID=UPI0021D22ECB|nr:sensor domain-containing diguanylate cyclase [Catenovulum sp. 2E275]MCU4677414.1 diguanylate cyclase [Catenovulum sp. 2E275]
MVAALIGIYTRPLDLLANLWPANAILLGIFLRFPSTQTPLHLCFAFIGFVIADMMTGSTLEKTLLLTTGNLVSVCSGIIFTRKYLDNFDSLLKTRSILNLIIVALVSSAAAGICGMFIYPYLFNGAVSDGWIFWFVSELVHYIAFLPFILAFPKSFKTFNLKKAGDISFLTLMAPALSVLFLCLLVVLIDGPGMVAIPVLGLLWCALSYRIFTTALLTLFFCLWTFSAVSFGYITLPLTLSTWGELMALRFSVAVISLVPIIISSFMQIKRQEISKLAYAANHDSLTGAFNRHAFMESLNQKFTDKPTNSIALLLSDLDHFKSINDQYGHPSGDAMLKHFYQICRSKVRSDDVIARIGGEEFAVILIGQDKTTACIIADRIRQSFAESELELENGQKLNATTSIGIVYSEQNIHPEELIQQADLALYRAKENGRNRVESYE